MVLRWFTAIYCQIGASSIIVLQYLYFKKEYEVGRQPWNLVELGSTQPSVFWTLCPKFCTEAHLALVSSSALQFCSLSQGYTITTTTVYCD